MTRPQALKLVMALRAAYLGTLKHASPEELEAFEELHVRHLLDLDARIAAAAVDTLCRTSKFLPTIAEIREKCLDAHHGPKRKAEDAWGDVLDALRKHGRTGVNGEVLTKPGSDFHFADPFVDTVVERMGWKELINSKNRVSERSRFCALYDDLVTKERTVAAALPGATSMLLPVPGTKGLLLPSGTGIVTGR